MIIGYAVATYRVTYATYRVRRYICLGVGGLRCSMQQAQFSSLGVPSRVCVPKTGQARPAPAALMRGRCGFASARTPQADAPLRPSVGPRRAREQPRRCLFPEALLGPVEVRMSQGRPTIGHGGRALPPAPRARLQSNVSRSEA